MNYAHRVTVVDSFQDLSHDFRCICLTEKLGLLNHIKQLAARTQLLDQIDASFVLVDVEYLQDVGVVQLRQRFHLFNYLFLFIGWQIILLDNLNAPLLQRGPVMTHKHIAIDALADLLLDFIVLLDLVELGTERLIEQTALRRRHIGVQEAGAAIDTSGGNLEIVATDDLRVDVLHHGDGLAFIDLLIAATAVLLLVVHFAVVGVALEAVVAEAADDEGSHQHY